MVRQLIFACSWEIDTVICTIPADIPGRVVLVDFCCCVFAELYGAAVDYYVQMGNRYCYITLF